MNKRKEMSDEQLAAYLDNMIRKERMSFKERFNCFSCRPQKFDLLSDDDNDYCVEEDFADDVSTLEVMKVSQAAVKFFENDKKHKDKSLRNPYAASFLSASRYIPDAGYNCCDSCPDTDKPSD